MEASSNRVVSSIGGLVASTVLVVSSGIAVTFEILVMSSGVLVTLSGALVVSFGVSNGSKGGKM